MPRGERRFCRAVALTGVPIVAYAKAWPGNAKKWSAGAVHRQVLVLMGEPQIVAGIAYYRSRMDTAPARIHFVSIEPMLSSIWMDSDWLPDWVIIGGETGAGARDFEAWNYWAADILWQCRARGIAYFHKQQPKRAPIPANLNVQQLPVAA